MRCFTETILVYEPSKRPDLQDFRELSLLAEVPRTLPVGVSVPFHIFLSETPR